MNLKAVTWLSTSVKNLGVCNDRYMSTTFIVKQWSHWFTQVTFRIEFLLKQRSLLYRHYPWLLTTTQTYAVQQIKVKFRKTKKIQFTARESLSNENKYDHITPHMNKQKSWKVRRKCNYDIYDPKTTNIIQSGSYLFQATQPVSKHFTCTEMCLWRTSYNWLDIY